MRPSRTSGAPYSSDSVVTPGGMVRDGTTHHHRAERLMAYLCFTGIVLLAVIARILG